MSSQDRLEQDMLDINTLSAFLARRGIPGLVSQHFDLLVVPGNSVIECCRVAVQALHLNVAPRVLLSGGVGHSTSMLLAAASEFLGYSVGDVSEAETLGLVMSELGADRGQLLLETRSTNTGENARFSRELAQSEGVASGRILLVQDPTLMLRTHSTFCRAWPEASFTSFAPFVPSVDERLEFTNDGVLGLWDFDRFIALLLGEIPRLRNAPGGYGPLGLGFIDPVDIPPVIEHAHSRLSKRYAARS